MQCAYQQPAVMVPMGQPGYAPAAQPGYAPVAQPGYAPTAPVHRGVGPHSSPTTCPNCRAQVSSRIKKSATTKAHIWAFVLCIFACIPCCLIPYCMDSCYKVNHYCPACNAYLGSYED